MKHYCKKLSKQLVKYIESKYTYILLEVVRDTDHGGDIL